MQTTRILFRGCTQWPKSRHSPARFATKPKNSSNHGFFLRTCKAQTGRQKTVCVFKTGSVSTGFEVQIVQEEIYPSLVGRSDENCGREKARSIATVLTNRIVDYWPLIVSVIETHWLFLKGNFWSSLSLRPFWWKLLHLFCGYGEVWEKMYDTVC